MVENRETVVTEPVRVDVRSVEKELTDLWKKASEGSLPGISAPVTRTILSNLLIYAATDAEANEAAKVVAELSADHPARAVVADAEPSRQGKELEADVSMMCSVDERGRRLCGEQVRLRPHGVTATALGTIVPVLIPDLPIYLWTPGDLTAANEVFRHLARVSDHWMIDSRRFASWVDRLRLVISLGPRHEPPVMLHDLAWVALAHWREAVAQHFDPQPAREYLRGITRVEIAYRPNEDARPPIEPVLVCAWLMRQLEWQHPRATRDDQTWTITADAAGRDVPIVLTPTRDVKQPIQKVVVESDVDGKHGVFSSTRADHADEVTIQAEAPNVASIRRTVRLSLGPMCSQVAQVLDAPGRDTLYEDALPILEGLVLEIEGRA